MDVSVIIPDNGKRHSQFVRKHYSKEYVVTTSFDDKSKARAVNRAARLVRADKYVIVDSDTLIRLDAIREALKYDWCIPFNRCIDLTEEATNRILQGAPLEFDEVDIANVRKKFKYAGGIWVINRFLFEDIGGVDERYAGWGGEDESFCRALETLHSPAVMLDEEIVHLWHPPCPTKIQFKRRSNWRLYMRYRSASRKPERMRELVAPAVKHFNSHLQPTQQV